MPLDGYSEEYPPKCTEEDAEEKMISRVLLNGLVLLALACPLHIAGASGSFVQAAQAQETQRAVSTPEFPGFTLDVTLSEKAMKKLVSSKETVIAAGYITGNPRKGALKKYVSEMGEVDLGQIQVEFQPGKSARFGEIKLKPDARAQTDGMDPRININVFSGGKSSKDNLIDCGFYEGSLKSLQGQVIPVACKLIGE
ncbi:MAG: hypothetical protein ABSG51_16765 [Terracidiphilus sp.]